MPPPKPRCLKAPLSSSRPPASFLTKRSGSNFSGLDHTESRRPATAGEVKTMSPLGMIHSLRPSGAGLSALTTTFTLALRMSMMSGGCMRRASLTLLCIRSIFETISYVKSAPLGTTASTSFLARSQSGLSCARKRVVQVEVMELVCWPAKRRAMRRPTIWSSVFPLPSTLGSPVFLYTMSMNTCKISVFSLDFSGFALLALMTSPKSSTILTRAASRFLWLAVGRFGKKKESGVMPLSRSWYRWLTSAKRFSRTSSP
mmetsp:Transcript_25594/g.57414  ORF Transcript_25594/g.57414 Transcript_25594/m.57414 type:complete len:258 (-) Transcript_25594:596-1369(-)